MTHAELGAALAELADRLAGLKPWRRGERFFVERHAIERRLRELAGDAEKLDPERRRRGFQTGLIVVRNRMIPVRVRRSFSRPM